MPLHLTLQDLMMKGMIPRLKVDHSENVAFLLIEMAFFGACLFM
jgi:hypothetical protein